MARRGAETRNVWGEQAGSGPRCRTVQSL